MSNINFVLVFLLAFLGSAFGSFGSVIIDRLFAEQPGILWGRSRCDNTGKLLRWWELVPVFSYVALGGKSAHNQKPIPFWYLAMELTFGAVFGTVAYQTLANNTSISALLILKIVLLFGALLLFFYDARHSLVDRRISFPAIAFALLWAGLQPNPLMFLLGGAIGFLFYWIQHTVSKGTWVGGGDQELGLFMGLILGWKGLLWGLLLSYIVGTVIAVFLMLKNKNVGLKSALPMGAFLMPILILFLLFPEFTWSLYQQYMNFNQSLIANLV